MKILVVDDNTDFRESVLDILELQGYSASGCGDGKTALTLLNECQPDLVLMDMVMPGIDGLETFRRMKAIKPLLPAIVISGFSMEDRRGQMSQEGIIGFVRKPINFPELFGLIESTKSHLPGQD